jgi:hypothetical protein
MWRAAGAYGRPRGAGRERGKGLKRIVRLGIAGIPRDAGWGGSGRGGLPAVPLGRAYTAGTVEGGEVGGPVRCDGRAVR